MLKLFKRKKPETKKRKFQAASTGRLFSSWSTLNTTVDKDLNQSLAALRARSRDLAQNNDYYKKYLQVLVSNVVGPNGIKLQAKAQEPNGVADKGAIKLIEAAWKEWGRRGSCDMTGKLSWVDAQELFIESVARDGEILVHLVPTRSNRFGFSLKFYESDLLDENYNERLKNGNEIRMGVEVDKWGKPVAYHLMQTHPGDSIYYSATRSKHYQRIPAPHMLHCFDQSRALQSRGYPWGVTAFTRLKNIEGYEESAIVNARIGASKMGFYISPDGTYTGDDEEDGNPIAEVEPGTFEVLPQGMDFKSFNPDYPNNEFDSFMKRTLMGIASGLGIPYVTLASDLEGVSYSSIRSGELEARDLWRIHQRWMSESLMYPVFCRWIETAIVGGALNLPPAKIEKFKNVSFLGRGWAWVDPSKDVNAKILEINNGLKSKAAVIGEMGGDYDDTQAQRAQENETEKALGLKEEVDAAET